MTDDIGDIAAFYGHGVEDEDSRLEQHQLEYDVTWRYLTKYLPPSGSILEIGAATGGYTLELCRRGYTVTAVDLSAALLERCQERVAAEGMSKQARFVVADARDLHAVVGTAFDAVLLMGPLYHLVQEADRQEAIRQAADRLRSGGVLFSAFLSRLGIFGDLLKGTPEWIERREEVASFLGRGRRPDDAPRVGSGATLLASRRSGPFTRRMGCRRLRSPVLSRRSQRTMTATTSLRSPNVTCGSTSCMT